MAVLVAFLYILLISYTTYKKPTLGICLVINSFFLNSALGLSGGMPFILIGAISLLAFAVMLLAKFFVLEGNKSIPLGIDGILGFLLVMILIATSIFGENLTVSITIILRFLLLCLSYGIMVKIVLASRGADIQDLLHSYMFVGVVIALFALIKGDSSSEYFMRLAIGSESSIPLSLLVAQSMLISLYFLLLSERKSMFMIYAGTFVLLLYILFLTNTRSTILASIISIVFMMVKLKKYKSLSLGVMLSMVLLTVIPSLAAVGVGDFDRVTSGFFRLLSGGFGESETDRVLAWSAALDIFTHNAFLGVGSGNFGQYYIVYPHNIYLELLSENGILGFLGLLAYTLYGMYLSFGARSQGVIVGALFLFSLVVSQVSLTLWMHKSMFFWFGALAYYTYTQKHFTSNDNSLKPAEG